MSMSLTRCWARVRWILSGSGMILGDRGTHALRGVPGHWQLYSVASDRPEKTATAATPLSCVAERGGALGRVMWVFHRGHPGR